LPDDKSNGSPVGKDLLRWPVVGRILRAGSFPFVAQAATLVLLVLLILGSWGIYENEARNSRYLADTNWATYTVWVLWWPLVIVSSVLLGRAWCMVCPLELLSTLANRMGVSRRFPWPRATFLPSVAFLLVVGLGVLVLGIEQVPALTAWYLLILAGVAVLAGLLFESRTFCGYLCPIGPILGIHALCAPLEWRAADPSECARCSEKTCISKKRRNWLFSRSCASNLYPPRISTNLDCLLCTQCANSCSKGNLVFRLRRFGADLFRGEQTEGWILLFSYFLSGFLLYELGVLWKPSRDVILYLPDTLIAIFNISNQHAVSAFRAAVVIGLYPLLWSVLPAALNRLRGGRNALGFWKVVGVAAFPILAVVHLVIALEDTVPKLKYLPLVLNEPNGVKTASLLVSREIKLSNRIPPFWETTVNLLELALLSLGLFASIAVARHAMRRHSGIRPFAAHVAPILLGGLFLALILVWKFR
jgi:hypothetical protein